MNVSALLKVLGKAWPLALDAWAAYRRWAKEHPESHGQVKGQVDAFLARVATAMQRTTPEDRIAAMLSAAEEVATGRTTTGTEQEKAQAESWLRQATDIRQALAVAEKAIGADRRRMLRRARARTDALVAEAFESLIPGGAQTASSEDLEPPRDLRRRLRDLIRRRRG